MQMPSIEQCVFANTFSTTIHAFVFYRAYSHSFTPIHIYLLTIIFSLNDREKA